MLNLSRAQIAYMLHMTRDEIATEQGVSRAEVDAYFDALQKEIPNLPLPRSNKDDPIPRYNRNQPYENLVDARKRKRGRPVGAFNLVRDLVIPLLLEKGYTEQQIVQATHEPDYVIHSYLIQRQVMNNKL